MSAAMALQGIEHVHRGDYQAIAVTSVVLRGDTVWCGLTAGRRCLVPFDLKQRRFGEAVDIFPWIDERPQVVLGKIHNALGLLGDGRLALGEGILYGWDGLPFEFVTDHNWTAMQKRRAQEGLPPAVPERLGPVDVARFDLRCMSGGVVLLYDPDTGARETVGRLPMASYVQSMLVDPERRMAYGHTLGDGHFFAADLARGTMEDHGKISAFAFHNLCLAPGGIVYGAWIDTDREEKLRVLRYDPAKGFVERLRDAYLDDPGPRVQGNRGIDQWWVHSSGAVYVGMAGDGQLYRFDPQALALERIGGAGPGGRVTSIVEDDRGRLVFTGGFPRMHVGRYDPRTGTLEDLGPVTDRFEKIYFHGAVYRDGSLFLAETDAGVASLWEVPLPA